MKKHTTSLELSKRLKKLGVKQESLFLWKKFDEYYKDFSLELAEKYHHRTVPDTFESCSAFLASELGEMLPTSVMMNNEDWTATYYLEIDKLFGNDWRVSYELNQKVKIKSIEHENLAEAMGLMLEYLLENKLIELEI